jgi:hypothetical protein
VNSIEVSISEVFFILQHYSYLPHKTFQRNRPSFLLALEGSKDIVEQSQIEAAFYVFTPALFRGKVTIGQLCRYGLNWQTLGLGEWIKLLAIKNSYVLLYSILVPQNSCDLLLV